MLVVQFATNFTRIARMRHQDVSERCISKHFMSFAVMCPMGKPSVERGIQICSHVIWELRDVHRSCPMLLYLIERNPLVWQSVIMD